HGRGEGKRRRQSEGRSRRFVEWLLYRIYTTGLRCDKRAAKMDAKIPACVPPGKSTTALPGEEGKLRRKTPQSPLGHVPASGTHHEGGTKTPNGFQFDADRWGKEGGGGGDRMLSVRIHLIGRPKQKRTTRGEGGDISLGLLVSSTHCRLAAIENDRHLGRPQTTHPTFAPS
ncbi:hypothetical protein LZ30DRAFT_814908, partial [Colletotrichum cereale]